MKKIAITLIIVVSVLIGIVKTLDYQASVRKHLPSGATEITEEVYGLNDFTRYMKAKCSEPDFHEFKNKLGYIENDQLTEDNTAYSWSQTSPDPVEAWWRPTRKIEGSYGHYEETAEFYSMTKYEDGYVYFIARKW
jgi:hypothetical protein